jgi:hypothetical protein
VPRWHERPFGPEKRCDRDRFWRRGGWNEPVEVRERMDDYVSAVNDDPFVKDSRP